MIAIVLSFLGGIFTHFIAHWLIVYVGKDRALKRSINFITKHNAEKRLKSLSRLDPRGDPHIYVTLEMLYAIYGLLSGKRKTALEAMLHVAELLHDNEKKIAYVALWDSHGTNQDRTLDKRYVEALQKTLVEP